MSVPSTRVRVVGDRPVRRDGAYVLYWMVAARRTTWSFGLQRAIEWSRELRRPLIVLEALRVGYPWASHRHHAFAIGGMADNQRAFADAGVTYMAYVEPRDGAGRGLLAALASQAAVVVTDDYPAAEGGPFFLPRMVAAAGRALPVRLEAVDGLGLLPLSCAPKAFARAVDLRRFLQRELPAHLAACPHAEPLAAADHARGAAIPDSVARGWPAATDARLAGDVSDLPIDPTVPVAPLRGGPGEGARVLEVFLDDKLSRYDDRSDPDAEASSGLSPWLHWGHVSAHEVVHAVLTRDGQSPDRLARRASDPDRPRANGAKEGWWGTSPEVESFLDEIVTWRELGHIWCARRNDAASYSGVPAWARDTLAVHARDARRVLPFEVLEAGRTGDPIWDAAQRQLRAEGRIHNYLRMVWGKRVLEWSATPEEAFHRLVALNDRWALDGRDPNSYAGIGWVFGRFDRAWGPERAIFGKVRYMSSENTRRKLRMTSYLARFGIR